MAEARNANYETIALKLGHVFRPSAPIDNEELYCGRTSQVRDVVDAINQPGRHAILYGERGVGKTSLGKILPTKLKAIEPVPVISPFVTCDSGDDFDSIWSKVMEEINGDKSPGEIFDEEEDGVHTPHLTPNDVRKMLQPVAHEGVFYVIIDEFDKVTNEECRTLLADTIKLLSDRAVPVTIVVIGVGDDVTGLIEDHESIGRCLAQVPMPRMPQAELEEIVIKGFNAVGMKTSDSVAAEIAGLSKGLPHYTHLLALYSGRKALDDKMLIVSPIHVENAIESAISQAQESIRTDYDKATYSVKKKTLFESVLLACSMAETDEFGRFQPTSLIKPMVKIEGKQFTTDRFATHLKSFCDPERGPVLLKTGGDYKWKYRFRNPLMQPFIIMKGLAGKKITKEDLDPLRDPNGQNRMFPK